MQSARAASAAAIDALARQQKLVADTQNSLNNAQAALNKAGSDTQSPHWHAHFIGDCTWKLSPHHHPDPTCVQKKEAIQNNVNRLSNILRVAQEALLAKEAGKNEAEATLDNLNSQKQDDFASKDIQSVLDELSEQVQDKEAQDVTGKTDSRYEEL